MPPQRDDAARVRNGADPDREPAPQVADLQARIDDLGQQLLIARDAAVGADAELGVAKARVREVEFQLDVSNTEIEELRAKVLELVEALEQSGGPGAARWPSSPRPVISQRLSPLLARTAKQSR